MRPNDKSWWEKAFPAAEWLRSYHRAWFRLDLLAGITLAAY
jgi:MFS superfamily sulfate permease-like transporter